MSNLKMSFYNGTYDKNKAIKFIKNTDKEIKFRYGFAYRGAKANPITKQEALDIIIKDDEWLDLDEYDACVVLNAYSANDMW